MCRCLLLLLVFVLGASPAAAQPKKLLDTKGWGKLTGRVTFDGDLPAVVDLVPRMMADVGKACCLAAPANQKVKEDWVIDKKSRGIANVYVWIKPPAGTYFPIHEADKARKDTVVIDQPFCTYVPHAVALFPHYFDGAKQVRTGQKFIVKNSATIAHSVRGTTKPTINDPFNLNIPPGGQHEFSFKAQPLPITLDCAFHGWMGAYVAVFDHPYFALTGPDGSFEIPRVPAGTEVTIMAWHEVVVLNALGIQGKQITLKAGDNEFNFKLKAK